MTKKLFFTIFLIAALSASAQVLNSENYNAYTIGNVSSTITASPSNPILGQGGMYVLGGTVANYQIVAGDAAHGNYLQVTGASDTSSYRYVLKNGLAAAWAGRTSGNNIVKGWAEIFTGTATNQHLSGFEILNSNYLPIAGVYYDSQARIFKGAAKLTINAQQGSYIITFGSVTTQYQANTWVKVGCTYNKTTGEMFFKIGNVTLGPLSVTGATMVPGSDPVYQAVVSTFGGGNTNSGPTTFGIDNYRIEASNNTTLGTSEVENKKSSIIAIGPNPTADYLNILTDQKITNLEIYDMSGRKVNVQLDGNKVDVKHLNTGSYIVSFETPNGKTTEKFIKK
ncbi:MAG: T9SS type A sorting domain-containing protein [Chryseobacterium sp.]|uniref:T9SS type A sorting domain-containing protein n=1 Tax=Chryseobacterium sp. TaxID=1871047 RepID=UPI00282A2019|nr:T9SS type A sorting domain-containing protein [Chryseobacterium sp.]MDR2237010.1 T9SS type A sorting domain-containing protein [Chryseobacterium sp.]